MEKEWIWKRGEVLWEWKLELVEAEETVAKMLYMKEEK